ncbi:disease resistance protein RPS4-like [Prunus avium]|uniref:Disease resistance protein RPS4-like n=1 Tax=Prunus avium TaxID=42229 RepID=A0A6P5SD26_PRUAV|nr:disease resistance protein RPS4-like [Prunus avium]
MMSISMVQESLRNRSYVAICYPGNEIPNWFNHKSEGCSIKIELPRDWFCSDFLGFALSLVVAAATNDMKVGCKYNFKTSNGESHEVNHHLDTSYLVYGSESHDVYVWWDNNVFEEVVEGAQSLAAFYKLVTEVNVDFTALTGIFYKPEPVRVEKCGICMLYGKDVEMIKQRAL